MIHDIAALISNSVVLVIASVFAFLWSITNIHTKLRHIISHDSFSMSPCIILNPPNILFTINSELAIYGFYFVANFISNSI